MILAKLIQPESIQKDGFSLPPGVTSTSRNHHGATHRISEPASGTIPANTTMIPASETISANMMMTPANMMMTPASGTIPANTAMTPASGTIPANTMIHQPVGPFQPIP